MARGFDNRKDPGGPRYGSGPNRFLRGRKRYGDIGRVSPGDELENTRDHERLWMMLETLKKKQAEIANFVGWFPGDISTLGESGDTPPNTVYQSDFVNVFSHTSFSFTEIPEADFTYAVIPRLRHFAFNGWHIQCRFIGHIYGFSGVYAPTLHGEGTTVNIFNFSDGNILDWAVDTGWQDMWTSSGGFVVDNETDGIIAMQGQLGGLGTSTHISSGSAYFRWMKNDSLGLGQFLDGDISPLARISTAKLAWPVQTITANYTLDGTEGLILADCTGGNIVIDTPLMSTNSDGKMVRIVKIDASANTVTFDPYGAAPVALPATTWVGHNQSDSVDAVWGTGGWWVF